MTPTWQPTEKALEQSEIYYPAPMVGFATMAVDANHAYAARQMLLESISQSHLDLAKDLSALEILVLSATNPSPVLEALDEQLEKIKIAVEALPSISLETLKFLQSLADPIEELREMADLIAAYELAAQLQELDFSQFEDGEEWKGTLAQVSAFTGELIRESQATSFRGLPLFLIPSLQNSVSQSQSVSRRERLDDLAVCTGAIRYFIELENQEHPYLAPIRQLNKLIDKIQYRQMDIYVTKSLCEALPELQELIRWLDEQKEPFSDVQNLKDLRSAILSLSDFSLGKLRDIEFAEAVKITERTKIQEFLAPTSVNLSGVSLEDEVPDHIISISQRIQVLLLLELDGVRGIERQAPE